jgi:hypothetical protein
MNHLLYNAIKKQESGMILVAIMSIVIFMGIIMTGIFGLSMSNLNRSHGRVFALEAQYAAESGADAAIAILNSGNTTYLGTSTDVAVLNSALYTASYAVTVASGNSNKERIITATGKVYSSANATSPTVKRIIRVSAQRSSSSTASSLVSRNILAIDSGVKNVYAKDIVVNGFISMAKNTTNLLAENITVAGKNTGSSNCSIGGRGNLVKPSSFSTSGQTKTNLNLAYNNCISPPGNTSNSDFTVAANQSNISTVQSSYIPWSQFMDSSYQNSANGCTDWTSGASPRTIPSTGNTKKTHYPDSSNGITTGCGSSGDLSLGSAQYNITDNVHVRANLCMATACSPTFYNPSSLTVKYIFVEGAVNFDSVQTASGSGPIVLITYGTDPSSKSGECPYGGSIYLGNGGSTSAPALYMLATNGICLSQTKFSSNPALGGVGGKNIYIATNSGTPFDLNLNSTFPVTSIPLDLSWRAVRYQRL